MTRTTKEDTNRFVIEKRCYNSYFCKIQGGDNLEIEGLDLPRGFLLLEKAHVSKLKDILDLRQDCAG
jgi:hypothetical protein